ncbi:hypothetical protein QR680_016511 [Steinernema hermaphroditum]|uniref:Uncharacterized protein n=1 Tax=Steinernema hermaphroditum TaxID=289476 RepID=A0AA39LM38_9BILA|nr:hypothetical protein QR680_016511 [Steinernema hermaphroditum]
MDYLPRAFYDDVFGQLEKKDIGPAQELAGAPGIAAVDHFQKRRELTLRIIRGTNDCAFQLTVSTRRRQVVPMNDLRSMYDRITHIFLEADQKTMSKAMSFRDALSKIAVALRFASNCTIQTKFWDKYNLFFTKQFFKLLGRSQTFKKVDTPNYGEECEEFVRKQMRSVHLQILRLSYGSWPTDFHNLVTSWTENPKFRSLHCYSMMLDYETVVSLLKRWANGELKWFSVDAKASFEKRRILRLLNDLECSTEDSIKFNLLGRSTLRIDFFLGSFSVEILT